MVPGN